MTPFPLLHSVLVAAGLALVWRRRAVLSTFASHSAPVLRRMRRGGLSISLMVLSASCAAARAPNGEPADTNEPTSNQATRPAANSGGSAGEAQGEATQEATPPPPPNDEGPVASTEVAEPPSPWQACQEVAECTVRQKGCCAPCHVGGYVPMRVDHANTLAAKCRREPVPCPACAAPLPPEVTCDAGSCAFK